MGRRIELLALIAGCVLAGTACSPQVVATPPSVPTPASALHCPGNDETPGGRPGEAIREESTNWAGYLVFVESTGITCVEGSWVHPSVSCSATVTEVVAIWVGIDGVKDPHVDASATLAQIGTHAGCDAGSRSDFAWFQALPFDEFSVQIPSLTVSPGDRISALVRYDAGTFSFQLVDVFSGDSFSVERVLADAPRLTAEWVVEAPMVGCPSNCQVASLPPFGAVEFRDAYAGTASHRGPIDDAAWTQASLEMVRSNTQRATVSGLGAEGTSFTVTWRHR